MHTKNLIVCVIFYANSVISWDYENQPWNFGQCMGSKQSPINLDSSTTEKLVTDNLDSMNFLNLNILNEVIPSKMENPINKEHPEHSLRYTFEPEIGTDSVKCLQTHFHFDTSEHFVNNQSYFGEMHVVCYKTEYGSYENAVASGFDDSIVVFGFHIDIDVEAGENNEISQMFDDKKECEENSQCSFNFVIPQPVDLGGFFRYYGSFTTPDCNEEVEWTVFEGKILISKDQATQIKSWGSRLTNNNRDLQELNGRAVYFSNSAYKVRNLFEISVILISGLWLVFQK